MPYPARLQYSDHVWVDASDRLRVEELAVGDLAARFGTPLFVTSEAQIRENVARFQRAYRSRYADSEIFFSTKAIHSLAVRRIATDAGAGADAFGLGELTLCLLAGTRPDMLVLNGSNKAEPEIEAAVSAGVPIHIDDPQELDLVGLIADRLGTVARVGLRSRLNLGRLDDMEADLPVGSKVGPGVRDGNKFGMHWEDFLAAGQRALKDSRFELVGLHHHVGRWNNQLLLFEAVVSEQVEWMARFADLTGWLPGYLDFGGGMALHRAEGLGPFGNDRSAPSIEDYAEVITGTLLGGLERFGLPHPRLIVEPGRSIASNTTVLLGSVGIVKRWPGHRTWVAVDASQNLLANTLTQNYYYHAVAANAVTAAPAPPVDIVGPLCSFDFLGLDRSLPPVTRGDLVAFLDTGAHCESKAAQFNMVPRPATVLVNGSEADVILERETIWDIIGRSRLPTRLMVGASGAASEAG